MSLADQFLADLEDDSSADEAMGESTAITHNTKNNGIVKKEEEMENEENDDDDDENNNIIKNDPIHYVKVYNSAKMSSVLTRITESKKVSSSTTTSTVGKDDYDLVADANSLASDISQDINSLHIFIKERYSKRFPELESLVLSPVDYANAVTMIGNSCDVTALNLASILPPATVMGITISASGTLTSQNVIPAAELARINKACGMLLSLSRTRAEVLDFVEGKLLFIAPNVSAIVGSAIAAKLIIAAGGLDELARMPSSNVQLIGQRKFNLSGFSTAEYRPHTGYIYECDAVESVPPELKMKACRLVAGK